MNIDDEIQQKMPYDDDSLNLMNPKGMLYLKDFADEVKNMLPVVVDSWNREKLLQLEDMLGVSFADYFENKKTQERTKEVAPKIELMLQQLLTANHGPKTFVVDDAVGYDCMWKQIPIECKITFAGGVGWPGNGYKKTPIHVLMRF